MQSFNIELTDENHNDLKEILINNTKSYANKIFEHKISIFPEQKYLFLKNLINIFSNNLVSIYLSKINEINELKDNKFIVDWKSSNIEISIEDFESFQNSLTNEFFRMFSKIENKLFSVKQINSSGQAVNIFLKLDTKQEYKYNSLKKIICFYIMN